MDLLNFLPQAQSPNVPLTRGPVSDATGPGEGIVCGDAQDFRGDEGEANKAKLRGGGRGTA